MSTTLASLTGALTNAVTSLPSSTVTAPATTTTGGNRAPPQGGVIEGLNPSKYNPKDPIIIFIIQASLILIICHLLHWPLSKLRQPRVIAEVIGGILLGPSVMGRIPGFRAAIFPTDSIPNLTLVANLGLVLYLFLIGLETDVHFLLSNWRVATSVAFAGMALPFALGCALAWGLYHQFSQDPGVLDVQFSIFMLFVGVAIAITAFPVLCRILTELKLLDTSVGVIVLSAGVANDVVGWILLALCVALVNAGSGLTALWILLACVGYIIFLYLAVKPALGWLLRRTGSIENGPSQSIIALILLIALASAFFTGIIGVHAIFGGFMVGLILPREGGFAIKVTEKLEDLIGALFLPLYFTLSGLNTDLGLLDSGIAWGYVVAVTLTAFFTKLIGASIAARLNKLLWRESLTIGVLMSCKGLVELIVLNIGLQAKILSTRTFTIFVVMALITTFATTPLASLLYPPWYQKKLEAWKRGEIDWDTGEPIQGPNDKSDAGLAKPATERVRRLLVYLRLDNMPATLGLVSLFGHAHISESHVHPADTDSKPSSQDASTSTSVNGVPKGVVRAHGLRLLQLTDRDSSVMTVSQVDEYSRHDPVVNIFRTVGQLHNLAVSGEVAVMPETRYAEALNAKSIDISTDLLLVPWSETGSIGESQILSSATIKDKITSSYTNFVKSVLQSTEHNSAVFFAKNYGGPLANNQKPDRTKLTRAMSAHSIRSIHHEFPTPPLTNRSHHIFLPYFGGDDDKLALMLVLQLCENTDVTATIVRFSVTDIEGAQPNDDYFGFISTHAPAQIASRVKFETISASNIASEVLDRAAAEIRPESRRTSTYNLIVLGRRVGQALEVVDGKGPQRAVDDVSDCLGAVAGQLATSGIQASLLVVQAKSSTPPPTQ